MVQELKKVIREIINESIEENYSCRIDRTDLSIAGKYVAGDVLYSDPYT